MTEEDAGARPENEQGNAPVETEAAPSVVDRANEAADRIEAGLAKQEELLKRQEALAVEKTLGGQSSAGAPPKKEETPEEYAAKVMANDL